MPAHFFGRDELIGRVREALSDEYSPDRVLFFTGNRGCGKTALLERLSQLAKAEHWFVVDVHSSRAVADMTSRIAGAGASFEVSLAPRLSLPGGASLSMGDTRVCDTHPTDLTDALLARCKTLGNTRGVYLAIDEIQKIPETDMEQICAAVQMARRKGLPVALMMAGLPGSKELVSSYGGCTFMQRVREVQMGSLRISETTDAFSKLLALVPNMEVGEGVVWELSSYSQGYPYLMQLLGYSLVEYLSQLYPVGVRVARVDHVVDIEDEAYGAYRRDVLIPSSRKVGQEGLSYLGAMAQLLDDEGCAATGEVAKLLNKELSQLSSARQMLIRRRLIQMAGRGKVRFALPHLSRFALEGEEAQTYSDDPDAWTIM